MKRVTGTAKPTKSIAPIETTSKSPVDKRALFRFLSSSDRRLKCLAFFSKIKWTSQTFNPFDTNPLLAKFLGRKLFSKNRPEIVDQGVPLFIDSSEISVGDPLFEDFWPIFAEKFSTQKFCEWRLGIKRVKFSMHLCLFFSCKIIFSELLLPKKYFLKWGGGSAVNLWSYRDPLIQFFGLFSNPNSHQNFLKQVCSEKS